MHQIAPLGVAVVGYGYWGPNLVRNAIERPELDFVCLCEKSVGRIEEFSRRYGDIAVEADFERVLDDPRVEAVVIATPPSTHHELASRALRAGKHVLVEKPLATTGEDAVALIESAEDRGLVLMPGHTFLYSPPVAKVRELICEGVVGEPYFVTSARLNLGNYQPGGVIWDLAPHDVSILLHLLAEPIVQVAASGRCLHQAGVPEVAFLTLTFASGATANVQVSWLAPRKVRQVVVVGSARMVQYEDSSAEEPVRIFDRGLEFSQPANFGEYQLTYRTGDIISPCIAPAEPLALELVDFAHAVRLGTEPRSSAQLGLEVVLVLEAATASFASGGIPVAVAAPASRPCRDRRTPARVQST